MSSRRGDGDRRGRRPFARERSSASRSTRATGSSHYQVTKLAYKLGLPANAIKSAEKFLPQVVRFFIDNDCSLAEINPLVVTEAGDVLALDAKITFDDNALFRHKPLAALRDLTEEDDAEIRAASGRAELRQARRQHRLPGQRRRPGDEHDGPDQAARRRAGQFPRRRRRRQRRPGAPRPSASCWRTSTSRRCWSTSSAAS